MLEHVHDEDGAGEREDVSNKGRVEVGVSVAVEAVVEAEQEGDEYARYDNVAEAEHGVLLGLQAVLDQILRKDELDGRVERLGHPHHHVRHEHPEDVVEEQAREQNAAVGHLVQLQELNAVHAERQAEQVVSYPVLISSSFMLHVHI